MAQNVGDAVLNIVVDQGQVGRAIIGAITGNEGTLASEGRRVGKSVGDSVGTGAAEGLTGFQKFGVGVAAVGAIVAGVSLKMALDFESSLTSIKALTGSSAQDIATYRTSILSLSGDVAQSPKALAEALYFVSSAGFAGKEAIDVLTISAKAAASGLTDTKVVADAVTSAMNAYGHSNLTARAAADVLTQTVTDGKAEFGDIAGAIGQVVGVASAAGISFAELGAGMAGLTSIGISADEAATTLKSTIIALEAPSDKVKDLLGQLGLSADDVRKSIRERGLIATIQDLGDRLHGQVGQILELIPNHRTLALVLGATGNQAQQYSDILGRVNHASDGAGATSRAFAERQKDVKFQLEQVKASAEALLVSFGEKLIPVVRTGLEVFRATVGFLDQNKVAAYALAVVVGGPLVAAMVAWVAAEARVIGGRLLDFWLTVAEAARGLASMLIGTLRGAFASTEVAEAAAGAQMTLFGAETTGATTQLALFGETETVVAGETQAMTTSFSGVGAGLGLIGAAVGLAVLSMNNAKDAAANLRHSLDDTVDAQLLAKFKELGDTKNTAGIAGIAKSLTGVAHDTSWDDLQGDFRKIAESSTGTAQRIIDNMRAQGIDTRKYQRILDESARGQVQAGLDAKKSNEIVGDAAKKMGVDTKAAGLQAAGGINEATQAQQKHQEAIDGVVNALKQVGPLAATAGTALAGGTKASDDELKKLKDSIDKVQDAYRLLPTDAGQALAILGAQGKLTADQIAAVAQEAKALRDGMASSFGSATSIVQAFANQTTVSAAQINKFFKDQVAAAREWSTNLTALVKAGVDQGLIAELAQAGPKAAPLVQGLLNDVKAGNLGAINQAQTDLRTILSNTQGTILGYETPFFVASQTAGSGVPTGIGQGAGAAKDAMTRALNEAMVAAQQSGATAQAVAIGKQIVDGLANGITQAQAAAIAAAANTVSAALDAMRRVARVLSPSKATMEIGQNIGTGLALGMQAAVPQVAAQARAMSYAALRELAGGSPIIRPALGSAASRISVPSASALVAATRLPDGSPAVAPAGGLAGSGAQVIENRLYIDGREVAVAIAPHGAAANRRHRRSQG